MSEYIGFARESGWGATPREEHGTPMLQRIALGLPRTITNGDTLTITWRISFEDDKITEAFILSQTSNGRLRKPTKAEWREIVSV